MTLYAHPHFENHENVSFFEDRPTGLRAIVAVHNTALGPAIGGCRLKAFASEEDVVSEALRLSAAQTRRAAVANMPVGGAAVVVWADPKTQKSPALFGALGRILQAFETRCTVFADMGVSDDEMREVQEVARNVAGLFAPDLRSPADVAASGVLAAMTAALESMEPGADITGKRVGVLGLGQVGRRLCELLQARGVELLVSDDDDAAAMETANRCGAEMITPSLMMTADLDFFAPCADSAVLSEANIDQLKCKIICGAASRPLAKEALADVLAERSIIYVPDFIAGLGGLLVVGQEAIARKRGRTYDQSVAIAGLAGISEVVARVISTAEAQGTTPLAAAENIVQERITWAENARALDFFVKSRRG